MRQILVLLILPVFLYAQSGQTAELLFENGNFYTVDPSKPHAKVMAVAEGRIIYIGDTIPKRMMTESTEKVNLNGQFVLPGFFDSHLHFMDGGYSLIRIDLRNSASPADFISTIKNYARSLPKGAWILGGNWDHTLWEGQPLPDRAWIDSVTADHPVLINRLDGHMSLANSLVIRLAGIADNIEDPPGGKIVRRADGSMSGVFKESAEGLIEKVIPQDDPQTELLAAEKAVVHLLKNGITSVGDMGTWHHVDIYKALFAEGKLMVRIHAFPPLPEWEKIHQAGASLPDSPFLKITGFKGYMDGSLGSKTARFFEPYLNDPENRGIWNFQMDPPEKMYKRIAAASSEGFQVVIHAIGTEANNVLLNMYEKIGGEDCASHRFRIEHAQHLLKDDVTRFGKLGVLAAMQPYHLIDDGRWAHTRLEPARLKYTYAFRDLLDSGASISFGSDWDVAPVSPLWGIYAAVTRRTLDGKNSSGWLPEQKITVAEAIKAYTLDAAYAEFSEKEKGSLSVGKWADFVVLSDNLFSVKPKEIKNVSVEMTVVAGQTVFQKQK